MPYVDVDHFGGVCRAVQHLVDAGRRRIATIAGPQDMVAGIDRLAGYRATLDEAGLARHVAVGDFTRESGVGRDARAAGRRPATWTRSSWPPT